MTRRLLSPAALVALLAAGCAGPRPHDYGAYLDHMPRSIVVLPPLNHTAEVRASDAFLSTVTTPLAERGYYVFPIAVVDRFMKENGLPTPGEMHQVAPQKFHQVLGADAVLYPEIREWKTQYLVIDSSTRVRIDYRLVDTRTGTELWRRQQTVVNSSSQGQSDPIGMLVSAAIHAGTNADGHRERHVAAQANMVAIWDAHAGMLPGHRHRDFSKEQARRAKERGTKKAAVASAAR